MLDRSGEIKSRVPIDELCKRYGLDFNRLGFAVCPFHSEKTPSFKTNKAKNTFHCFGCGEGGSVIDFVMKIESCSFADACKKLDAMYGLGLYEHISFVERRRLEREERARKNELALQKQAEEYSAAQLNILDNYYRWLVQQECTEAIQADLDYLDRIFNRTELITWDAQARINALLEKHPNRGDYDKQYSSYNGINHW